MPDLVLVYPSRCTFRNKIITFYVLLFLRLGTALAQQFEDTLETTVPGESSRK